MEWIVVIAVLLNAIWGVVYIKDTISWKTKPNRVTWFIWALAPLIATAASLSDWVEWAVLPVFMSGFIPLLIFISSFYNKESYWKLWKLDYFCLIFSLLAIVLWVITQNPLLAIIFAILADLLAAFPTLIKIYKYPETETVFPFFTWVISASSAFLVIEIWKPEEYLFPSYLILICLALIIGYYNKKIISYFK